MPFYNQVLTDISTNMLFSLGLAGDMVGQEAGSGLWSGVSGVPGEFALFREFLPGSFLSFVFEVLNTTFLGFLCCGCFYLKVVYLLSWKF